MTPLTCMASTAGSSNQTTYTTVGGLTWGVASTVCRRAWCRDSTRVQQCSKPASGAAAALAGAYDAPCTHKTSIKPCRSWAQAAQALPCPGTHLSELGVAGVYAEEVGALRRHNAPSTSLLHVCCQPLDTLGVLVESKHPDAAAAAAAAVVAAGARVCCRRCCGSALQEVRICLLQAALLLFAAACGACGGACWGCGCCCAGGQEGSSVCCLVAGRCAAVDQVPPWSGLQGVCWHAAGLALHTGRSTAQATRKQTGFFASVTTTSICSGDITLLHALLCSTCYAKQKLSQTAKRSP